MAEYSDIEWTDATWNVATGCQKVSPGCAHCYAERIVNGRLRGTFPILNWHEDRLRLPLVWKKPRRIFVNALSDLWWKAVLNHQRDQVLAIAALAQRHTFQFLTKRAEEMHDYFAQEPQHRIARILHDMGHPHVALQITVGLKLGLPPAVPNWPLKNVWLGVSVEDQQRAAARIPWLLRTRAAVRFVSGEPLLGGLDLSPWLYESGYPGKCINIDGEWWHEPGSCSLCHPRLDWVIVGGESGPAARPMPLVWARSLRDQCNAARVPFFFKQWGLWRTVPVEADTNFSNGESFNDVRSGGRMTTRYLTRDGRTWRWGDEEHRTVLVRMKSKKHAGRLLDGRTWDEMPRVAA